MAIITTERLLEVLSNIWTPFDALLSQLGIENDLDKRFLRVKLKELDRKGTLECVIKEGVFFYKKNGNVKANGLKKEFVNKKSPKSNLKGSYGEGTFQKPRGVLDSFKLKILNLENQINGLKIKLKKNPNDKVNKILLNEKRNELSNIYDGLEKELFFLCPICKRSFRSKGKLENHYKLKHEMPFKCPFCDKKFPSESDLAAHRKIHEIDFHGLTLPEAILKVKKKLKEYLDDKRKGAVLIHGYRHGTNLKSYFRSTRFIRDLYDSKIRIDLFETEKPGFTSVLFKDLE